MISKTSIALSIAVVAILANGSDARPSLSRRGKKDKNPKSKPEGKKGGTKKNGKIQKDPVQTEGFDMRLSPEQFVNSNTGSLLGMPGTCDVPIWSRRHVNFDVKTIDECLEWCINVNVDDQSTIGACQFSDDSGWLKKPVCVAFKSSLFHDGKVESKESAGSKCYSLFQDKTRRSSRALVVDSYLWPNNEVIYSIVDASDPDSWESNGHSQSSALFYIQQAFNEYHTKTNVRFVERTTQSNYVSIGYYGGGCSSYVGKINIGAQRVTLGWCRASLGSIIHELGHSSGLWHEHTRADRDTYISVPSGANGNFAVANTNSRGLAYDFSSIMHYPMSTTWSDGTGTIVMTKTAAGDTLYASQGSPQIGQRNGLSGLDIDGLDAMYPPAGPPTAPPQPGPVDQGSLVDGDIKSGDTRNPGTSSLGGASPDHTYSVTIATTATYTFSTCGGATFDTYLRLYNEADAQVAYNDDSCSLQSKIEVVLSPGVYTLLVEGYGSNAGVYNLAMTSNAPPPPPTTAAPTSATPTQAPVTSAPTAAPQPSTTVATTISPADAVNQGTIASGETKSGNTQTPGISYLGKESFDHTYDVVITTVGEYTFSTCGNSGFDTWIVLYDSGMNEVATNDDACSLQSIIVKSLNTGTYLLLVNGYSTASGAYTLTMTGPTTPSPPTSSPTPLPTTSSPTTSSPTTSSPTPLPTTSSPTTSSPTPLPTTSSPTTSSPTTSSPTPLPTTSSPTTSSPTTSSGCHVVAPGGSNYNNQITTECVSDDAEHWVRCCSDSDSDPYPAGKWTKKNIAGCPWAASKRMKASTSKACPPKFNYAGAAAYCIERDARLCTLAEVQKDCTKGTGCSVNRRSIWTTDTSL